MTYSTRHSKIAAPHHIEFEVHPKHSRKHEEVTRKNPPMNRNKFEIQVHREYKGVGERWVTEGRERTDKECV
jgi:hypothetical protein